MEPTTWIGSNASLPVNPGRWFHSRSVAGEADRLQRLVRRLLCKDHIRAMTLLCWVISVREFRNFCDSLQEPAVQSHDVEHILREGVEIDEVLGGAR